MQHVEGKVAFITGGASGIGLGMAKAFAKAGMNCVLADVRDDHIEQARAWFDEAGRQGQVHLLELDVTDRAAYAAAADEAERVFGKVHVLCNNAGIGISAPVSEASYEDWDWGVEVNLTGVFNGVHTLLPRIRAHGEGGHIVNTASMGGVLQYSRAGVYVTTKFAVVGLSEALHAELIDEPIGVSAFCPGGVRTNIRDWEKTRPARYVTEASPAAAAPPRGFNMSEEVLATLNQMSWEPEEVGEMVLNGIRTDALYIFTSPEFRPGVVERFEAILEVLGDDPALAAKAREHVPNLVSSPIYAASTRRARAAKQGS
ncbi:MAG TPA: SDR family NAD(P)-dependent oxidoreductase [Caulobacteraceae bacterium]